MQPDIEFLDHIISGEGVSSRWVKIVDMVNFSKSCVACWGWLDSTAGLCITMPLIAGPLMELLKKNSFN